MFMVGGWNQEILLQGKCRVWVALVGGGSLLHLKGRWWRRRRRRRKFAALVIEESVQQYYGDVKRRGCKSCGRRRRRTEEAGIIAGWWRRWSSCSSREEGRGDTFSSTGTRYNRHVHGLGHPARLHCESAFGDDTAERDARGAFVPAPCDGTGRASRVAFQSSRIAQGPVRHHSPLHLQDHRRQNWARLPSMRLPHNRTHSRGRSVGVGFFLLGNQPCLVFYFFLSFFIKHRCLQVSLKNMPSPYPCRTQDPFVETDFFGFFADFRILATKLVKMRMTRMTFFCERMRPSRQIMRKTILKPSY